MALIIFPKTRNVEKLQRILAEHPIVCPFLKKALAILFLAPSCEEKKYVQSSNWETTADSLLILFSAHSCHPGSHQKKAKWPNSQNNKISWEVLRKLSHATSRSHSDRKKFEDQHGAFERLTYENILSLMDYKSQLLLGAI